jgi:cell division protein FtsB
VQSHSRKSSSVARPDVSNASVTSAVGMQETEGSLRARRNTLFTQTVIWVTGLICTAFLLGSLAQAWSNSQLARQVQDAQQQLQQMQMHHDALVKLANHYSNPGVIENEARQQLGYIRPGEHAVVIISAPSQEANATSKQAAQPVHQSFWQDWWNTFFGN